MVLFHTNSSRYSYNNVLIPQKGFHLVNIILLADKADSFSYSFFGNSVFAVSSVRSELGILFLPKLKLFVLIKSECCITGERFPLVGTSPSLSAEQQRRRRAHSLLT